MPTTKRVTASADLYSFLADLFKLKSGLSGLLKFKSDLFKLKSGLSGLI